VDADLVFKNSEKWHLLGQLFSLKKEEKQNLAASLTDDLWRSVSASSVDHLVGSELYSQLCTMGTRLSVAFSNSIFESSFPVAKMRLKEEVIGRLFHLGLDSPVFSSISTLARQAMRLRNWPKLFSKRFWSQKISDFYERRWL